MSEERPLDQRPAARPVQPPEVPGQASPPEQAVPPKKGMGCFGIASIGIIVAAVIITVSLIITTAVRSGSSGPDDASDGGSVSGDFTDPIEQARVVLGDAYTYEEIKSVTDAALLATDTDISNENYSRAWSSVLKVTDSLTGVAPMDVMRCVSEFDPSFGVDFPDAAALCATEIHLEG